MPNSKRGTKAALSVRTTLKIHLNNYYLSHIYNEQLLFPESASKWIQQMDNLVIRRCIICIVAYIFNKNLFHLLFAQLNRLYELHTFDSHQLDSPSWWSLPDKWWALERRYYLTDSDDRGTRPAACPCSCPRSRPRSTWRCRRSASRRTLTPSGGGPHPSRSSRDRRIRRARWLGRRHRNPANCNSEFKNTTRAASQNELGNL